MLYQPAVKRCSQTAQRRETLFTFPEITESLPSCKTGRGRQRRLRKAMYLQHVLRNILYEKQCYDIIFLQAPGLKPYSSKTTRAPILPHIVFSYRHEGSYMCVYDKSAILDREYPAVSFHLTIPFTLRYCLPCDSPLLCLPCDTLLS